MTASRTPLSGAFGSPSIETNQPIATTGTMSCSLSKNMDATFDDNGYSAVVDVSLTPPQRKISNRKMLLDSSPKSVAGVFMLDDVESLDCLPSVPISDDESDDTYSLETVDVSDNEFAEKWSDEPSSVTKKVRFLVDEDGDIDEDVTLKSYPKHELTPQDITKLWWSKADRREAKASIPRECRDIIQVFPQYRRAALKLCALASRKDYAELISSHEVTRQSLPLLTRGTVRGLERPMFFRMALPRKPGKTYVNAILRTQSLLRDLEGDVYSEEEKAELISDQYRENSRFAVRFAEILAVADAMEIDRDDVFVC